jgi:hypothetical protein
VGATRSSTIPDDGQQPVPSRPLGRSLDPLADEELGGYLLRLSAHLSMTPLSLARHLGLPSNPAPQFNRKLLFTLDVDGFAARTRLTPQEAGGLTLLGWRNRYPPISQLLVRGLSHNLQREWLLNHTARYCHRCLAGDGSEVQTRHGGAWKKHWRLPVSFTCVEHAILLHDECARTHARAPRTPPLVANPGAAALHPTQCRQSTPGIPRRGTGSLPCGASLLHPLTPDTTRSTSAQLETQQRILACLEPGVNPDAAGVFFTDLRLIAALLRTGWPNDRSLIDPDTRDMVGEHFRLCAENNVYDQPPRDAATTAAVLSAAIAVLDDSARQEELARCIRETRVGRPSREPWVTVLKRHASSCSPQVREAFEPLSYTYRLTGRYGKKISAPASISRYYRPEYVPAFLEPSWYRHLAAISIPADKINPVRRYAAIRMVQWVTGSSPSEAARYLGLPPGKAAVGFAKGERRRFDQALNAIVRTLELTPAPVDYQARRTALGNWCLTGLEWERFVESLRPFRGRRDSMRTDELRQQASVFIWVRITQGEHEFAPRPVEAAQPDPVQRAWRHERLRIQRQFEVPPRPNGFYAAIRPVLINYAAQLAHRIDVGDSLGEADKKNNGLYGAYLISRSSEFRAATRTALASYAAQVARKIDTGGWPAR